MIGIPIDAIEVEFWFILGKKLIESNPVQVKQAICELSNDSNYQTTDDDLVMLVGRVDKVVKAIQESRENILQAIAIDQLKSIPKDQIN